MMVSARCAANEGLRISKCALWRLAGCSQHRAKSHVCGTTHLKCGARVTQAHLKCAACPIRHALLASLLLISQPGGALAQPPLHEHPIAIDYAHADVPGIGPGRVALLVHATDRAALAL